MRSRSIAQIVLMRRLASAMTACLWELPPGGEQPQVSADLVTTAYRLQVGAHSGLVGDDPCVLPVGLAITSVGRCRVVDDPAWDGEHLLATFGEQRDQQCCASGVEVCRPHRFAAVGDLVYGSDQLQQRRLVIDDTAGQ